MIEITTHVRGAAAMRATAAYLQAMALIAEAESAAARGQTVMGGAVGGAQMAEQQQRQRVADVMQAPRVIAPEDAPDVGAPLPPPVVLPPVPAPATDHAAAVAAFGTVPPAPASVPLPPPVVPAAPVSASGTTVPPAPPVAASSPSGGVDLDKRGMPWDSRIHSTPATKTADEVWRKRRGVDDFTVARVEAELRGALGAPAPAATVPAAPAVPVAPSVPPAPGEPANLADLLQAAAPLMQTGKITMATVLDAAKAQGLDGLGALQVRPDLVPAVWRDVQAKVAA